MNKVAFINELKSKLKRLPKDELENVLSYYNEYFEDAQIDENQDLGKEFESPSTIASQILADYAVKETTNKSKLSSIWFIILAVLASPIALPLAFAGVVVIIALIVVLVAVLFSCLLATLSVVFTGGVVVFAGIGMLFTYFSSAALLIGVGITLCGVGLLLALGLTLALNKALKLIVQLANKILSKLNKKELI